MKIMNVRGVSEVNAAMIARGSKGNNSQNWT